MLLAVDTSTRAIGVALYDGVQVLNEMSWISKNHHTIELAPAVDQSLTRIGASPADIQALGVAIGPGSFTGLRIGLALVKGLALSHKLPLMGIPTLDIVAGGLPAPPGSKLVAVLEAGRRRLAIGRYHPQKGKWRAEGELQNLTIEEFVETITEPVVVCGELSREARERLGQTQCRVPPPVQCLRRPAILAALAWQRWQAGQMDDPATLKPVYFHHGEPIPG
jgi:tRNA threonylcarbamoyladenosine biosynthesis protein TsaB